MKNSYIKYRIAFNNATQKLIDIDDTTEDIRENLLCLECKEDFIAVLNHSTPHFKHKPNSKCSGNDETYIHWVSKELFKTIKEIELPQLRKTDLNERQQKELEKTINKLIVSYEVPKTACTIFKKGLKENISEGGKYYITKIDIEKPYKTEIGNVRIDIVATILKQELFIEPYYTSEITPEKKERLTLLNIPTIAINLLEFPLEYGQEYKTENLKQYLICKKNKSWVFNREKNIEKHMSEYEEYVSNELEKNKELFETHRSKLEKISNLKNQIEINQKAVSQLHDQIVELDEKISQQWKMQSKLEKELGILENNYGLEI